MTDQQEYLFATGRLVQGSVFEPQTKTPTGAPMTDKQGNPKVQYFIAVAVDKTNPDLAMTVQKLQAIAQAGFPNGESQRPDFAWKYIDGDVAPHNSKPGFPGCTVFRLTSGFPVQAYTKGAESQITDPQAIKRGYYVRAAFTVKPNGDAMKPGLYLNLALVELIGYGEEIASGPDAKAVLGAAGAAAMPAGASAAPVASGPPLQPSQTPQAGPPAPAAPPEVPGNDFLTPPIMTPKAAGMTYQQFIDAGWTNEQLKAHGYIQ